MQVIVSWVTMTWPFDPMQCPAVATSANSKEGGERITIVRYSQTQTWFKTGLKNSTFTTDIGDSSMGEADDALGGSSMTNGANVGCIKTLETGGGGK